MIEVDGRRIGGEHFTMIAGPCTVESRDQTLSTAHVVAARRRLDVPRRRLQAALLAVLASRASVQEGLRILAEAKAQTGLPIVTELMDARDVEPIVEVADVIQVGARNMQNYPLLAEIGRTGQTGADQARAVAPPWKSC